MKWGTLAVACLAMLMLALDLTVLHLAVPKLTTDLAPSATQLLWIVDAYGFALAGLLVTMGNIGDRIGRKKLLLIGAATFGVASVITAYAPTAELLIAARVLLGVAGATIMPSTLSLIRNVFTEPTERTAAIGLWNGIAIAGFGLGPVIGGVLLDHFWWGSVFMINVPVVLLILVVGLFVLPESRNPSPGPLDWVSVPLSVVGVIAVVYAIKQAAYHGFGPEVWIAAAVGAVTLFVFVRRQTQLTEPLIDVRLFRRGAFSLTIGAALIAMFAQLAISLVMAQYLQLVLGWSPLLAGLAGLPAIVAAVAGALASPAAINLLGRAGTMTVGLALSAVGMVLYGQVGIQPTYGYLLLAMLIFGVGLAMTMTVATDTILAAVPKERAGAASAISETAMELGGALGIAVLGSLLSVVYRLHLPADASAAVRESLGNASPPELAVARAAFVDGLQVTLFTSAAVVAVLAVAVLFALRKIPRVIEASEPAEAVR